MHQRGPGFVQPGYWANALNPSQPAAGDAKAVWIGGDYHLKAGSACIDAGDPAPAPGWALFDIDGQRRPIDSRPDLGCDEFAPQP